MAARKVNGGEVWRQLQLRLFLTGCTVVEHQFDDDDYAELARDDARRRRVTTSVTRCPEKVAMNQHTARRAARIIGERGEDVHAYECNVCHRWHVGHGTVFRTGSA